MRFPIIDLLGMEECKVWLEQHFHPDGFCCPHCQASLAEARKFRETKESQLTVYRCGICDGVYNLYTGTLFESTKLSPQQVILLLRGVMQGTPSNQLAEELDLTEKTVLMWRHRLQEQAEAEQRDDPLPDEVTESDEMFQNAGKKRYQTTG
jgi:transposase-like protein